MNHFLHTKSDSQRFLIFILIASLLAIIWGLIGYYVILGVYFIVSFLFYLGIFLIGMLFKVRNCLFMPVTYSLVYGSDLICRSLIESDKETHDILSIFLILYTLELIVLTLKKLSMDAKDYKWDTKKKRINRGVALILPVVSICIYYFIIRQIFVFE